MRIMLALPPTVRRRLGAPAAQRFSVTRHFAAHVAPNASLVDARNAPNDFDPMTAVVYNEFITDKEGDSLVQDIAARMKR